MKTLRLVVAGSVGAGKSTFVRTISEIEVVDTDRTATDHTSLFKSETTVALDFGRLVLSPDMDLHIYGTPGQARFDFMWDLLIQNAHCYILLVAANRPNDFNCAREIIAFINKRVKIPMIIGLTHMDCPGALIPEEIVMNLGYDIHDKNRPPIVNVNPQDRTSVLEALIVLMGLVIAGSNAQLSYTP
jgi:signal recognition particle receptor subunit beta